MSGEVREYLTEARGVESDQTASSFAASQRHVAVRFPALGEIRGAEQIPI